MRVAIAYPPLESAKGVPLLSQNRQFQWFNRPTYIYPVVPATAATMLRNAGHAVGWLDGIAAEWSRAEFDTKLREFAPAVLFMETKTPVVKTYWEIIKQFKASFPAAVLVLAGDHVTAFPEESMRAAPIDYLLTGGDYDFLLLNLVNHLANGEALEAGIWLRGTDGAPASTGAFELNHDLNKAPWIDRDLTQWRLYAEKNGNFRRTPGTYLMSARDCWHGRCTFCSWTTLYPKYRSRDPIDCVNEIEQLVERYGVREIMDDAGSLPVGEWLETFCHEMIRRGLHRRLRIDCNMRFGRLTAAEYKLMRRAGFRLTLFGLESANQATLDRLDKALTVAQVREGARLASRAGLDVHVTVMFGYPWEGAAEIEETVALARWLLRKGYAYTLQCTMVVPYPGTPLFKQLRASDLLTTLDWDDYDMRTAVIKTPVPEAQIKDAVRRVYKGFLLPETLVRRILTTRHPIEDLRFYARGFLSLIGHLRDFKN